MGDAPFGIAWRGNAIGSYFIELAKRDMRKWHINLPDRDLAYFPEGTDHFDDYVGAVGWAQDFAAEPADDDGQSSARCAEQIMASFDAEMEVINCHHNYVQREVLR